MKLDVGCGDHPKGDINVDLFIGKTPHSQQIINPKNIRNFIKAHIHYLPFAENTFSETSCFHVLEHKGVDFFKALNELMRVTDGIVELEIPHRFGDRNSKRNKMHDKCFSITSIEKELQLRKISFQNDVIYSFFPHPFIPLVRLSNRLRIKIACSKL